MKGHKTRNAYYEVYDTLDKLCDLYPFETEDIKEKFPNYHGRVYVFDENLDEFAIYELTEGIFYNMIDFDIPYTKLIGIEDVIDWNTLADNILKIGIKNVVDHVDVVYVLADMKL